MIGHYAAYQVDHADDSSSRKPAVGPATRFKVGLVIGAGIFPRQRVDKTAVKNEGV
jgi:hypothetical protein